MVQDPKDPSLLHGAFRDSPPLKLSRDGGRTWSAYANPEIHPKPTDQFHDGYCQALCTGPDFVLAGCSGDKTKKAPREDANELAVGIGQDLSSSLAAANLKAAVDPNSGDIMLDSAVFFETGSAEIRQEGKDLLDRFIPVYLDVLLRDTYSDYLGEIIIEGHTDSKGSYESNLKLSQNRALQVALYCLKMPSLTAEQKQQLQKILTAKGRSYADLIYVDGVEDAEASRRVEFKFSLKDSEMIDEMNRILSGN